MRLWRLAAPAVIVAILAGAGPAAASVPAALSVTLVATPDAGFSDEPFTLTATVAPAVADLPISFHSDEVAFAPTAYTNDAGVATVTFTPITWDFFFPVHYKAVFDGDASYAAAESNVVALDISRHPTVLTLTAGTPWGDDVPVAVVDPLVLTAHVSTGWCSGSANFWRKDGDTWTPIGADSVRMLPGGLGCGAQANVGQQALGSYQFRVTYDPTYVNEAGEDTLSLEIGLVPSQVALGISQNPVEVSHDTYLTATVSSPKGVGFTSGGTITFYDGATEIGSAPQTSAGASIWASFDTTGTHQLHATWSGTTTAAGSTSPDVALVVSTNVVHAANVTVSATTFYPVVDTFKDTVLITGQPQEQVRVDVAISNGSGTVVRRLALASAGPGSYVLSWNGRNTAGSIVPAGAYRVRQVLTDLGGAKLTVDRTVTVSLKKLAWTTGSITLYGSQVAARGQTSGTSVVVSPLYAKGARITFPKGVAGRWVGLGYQVTMPSAVAYSSLSFSVLGSGTHTARIGPYDRRIASWTSGSWVIEAFSPLTSVPTSYRWTKANANATYGREGRLLRGLFLADNWASGRYDIAKVKFSFRYAVLK